MDANPISPRARGADWVKWSGATRAVEGKPRLEADVLGRLAPFDRPPRRDDVVVAEVVEVHRHRRLELEDGRVCRIFADDLVGVAFGYRYATSQYEGIIPGLRYEYDLLSVGGVCGEVIGKPELMEDPTRIRPLGYLLDAEGRSVCLREHGVRPVTCAEPAVPTILVVGTSMSAGKTTAAASLVSGLTRAGATVSAGKLTGTATARDGWLMFDSGARRVMDFTAVGHASTAMCELAELAHIYQAIWSHLAADRPDFIVLEIADGLAQRETEMLLAWVSRSGLAVKVLCAARDRFGVESASDRLRRLCLDLVGVSGRVTDTPLGVREAREATSLPVWTVEELGTPAIRDFFEVPAPAVKLA